MPSSTTSRTRRPAIEPMQEEKCERQKVQRLQLQVNQMREMV